MLTPVRSDISAGVNQLPITVSIPPPNNLECTPGQPRDGFGVRRRHPAGGPRSGQVRSLKTEPHSPFSVYSASTRSSSTTASRPRAVLSATHHSAPGRPAEAYAVTPAVARRRTVVLGPRPRRDPVPTASPSRRPRVRARPRRTTARPRRPRPAVRRQPQPDDRATPVPAEARGTSARTARSSTRSTGAVLSRGEMLPAIFSAEEAQTGVSRTHIEGRPVDERQLGRRWLRGCTRWADGASYRRL